MTILKTRLIQTHGTSNCQPKPGQSRMFPFAVVEQLDVFGDGEPCTGPGFEPVPVEHLVFQGREK